MKRAVWWRNKSCDDICFQASPHVSPASSRYESEVDLTIDYLILRLTLIHAHVSMFPLQPPLPLTLFLHNYLLLSHYCCLSYSPLLFFMSLSRYFSFSSARILSPSFSISLSHFYSFFYLSIRISIPDFSLYLSRNIHLLNISWLRKSWLV